VMAAGLVRTPDLGGKNTTQEFAAAVAEQVRT
jgi:isocitrate/isopropylmalate dehydrogenase